MSPVVVQIASNGYFQFCVCTLLDDVSLQEGDILFVFGMIDIAVDPVRFSAGEYHPGILRHLCSNAFEVFALRLINI